MMHKPADDVTSCPAVRPSLLSLRVGQCRWPLGDPRTSDFAVCGEPALGRYCPDHTRRGRARAQPSGPVVPGIDDVKIAPPVRFATHMDRWA